MEAIKEMKNGIKSRDIEPAEIIVGQKLENGKVVDKTVKVRLIGRKLHLLRCLNGKPTETGVMIGNIVMPDELADRSWWYKILAVSEDCKYFKQEHVGGYVRLTDNGCIGNSFMVGPAERVVREAWLEKRTDNPFCVIMEE